MRKKTRYLTVSALLAALAAAMLYIGSMFPVMELGLAALSGLVVAAAVIECGPLWALGCFAVAAVLGLLLCPVKAPAVLFSVFFGYYPVLKSVFERQRRPVEWILKLLLFLVALTAAVLLLGFGFIGNFKVTPVMVALVYMAGAVCFVLYDTAFSKLAATYVRRIYKKR